MALGMALSFLVYLEKWYEYSQDDGDGPMDRGG